MKKEFGLFKINGERARYGDINCIGLTKMMLQNYDTLEELEQEVIVNPNIPPANDYIVIQYWNFTKPRPETI